MILFITENKCNSEVNLKLSKIKKGKSKEEVIRAIVKYHKKVEIATKLWYML